MGNEKIPEGWQAGKLGDFITLQRGFDLPQYNRKDGTVPVITSAGVTGFHCEHKVEGPGVVMGRYGTIGQVFYIQEKFWPHNTSLYVRNFKGNNPRFIFYFLKTINYQSHNDKSSVPGLNRNHVHMTDVLLPPLPIQRRIAHVLGTLDDRIERNRKMNATLEAIARALFTSWFVTFDPVRAKADGRDPPGMDAATAALFPDSFEDSPVGKIPQGWRVGLVSDICTTQYGYTASASEEPIGPQFLRIKDMNKSPWIDWLSVPYCKIDNQGLSKYMLKVGDILVSRIADPGKVAIVEENRNAVFASYLVRLKTSAIDLSYFLFYFLQSEQYLSYAQGAMSGSVQNGMNAKVITAADILIPPSNLIQAFHKMIYPLRQKITNNLYHNRTLAELRDALLPKLLSGEIDVSEVEV